jgi:hypothetical protein
MVIEKLHFEVKRRCEKNYTKYWKGLSDAELDALLITASNDYVDLFFSGRNDKKYRVGFEVTQQRLDMLSNLVVGPTPHLNVFSSDATFNVYEFKLNQLQYPYRHFVRGNLEILNCDYLIGLSPEQTVDLNTALSDENRKPSLLWKRAIWQMKRSSDNDGVSIYVYTNGEFTPTKLYLEYVKQPDEVCLGTYNDIPTSNNPTPGLKPKVESDIPENFHEILVRIAVQEYKRMMENVNRVQVEDAHLRDLAS